MHNKICLQWASQSLMLLSYFQASTTIECMTCCISYSQLVWRSLPTKSKDTGTIRLIGNHTHSRPIWEIIEHAISKIILGFVSYNVCLKLLQLVQLFPKLDSLPKLNLRHDRRAQFGWSLWPHQSTWVIPFPTSKETVCTEGLLAQHALGMLGRTLLKCV